MNIQAVSTVSMPDPMPLETTLRTRLPFRAELAKVVPLSGDASNRRYYRLELKTGPVSSLILMQLADPEAFKSSEEAMGGTSADVQELPFLNVRRTLAQAGVPVPALYFYDEAAGFLYLQDFGDVTLWHACAEGGTAAVHRYYPAAVDTLVHIHLHLTASTAAGCQAFSRSFDVPLLMWEFEHFLEYGVRARRDKRPMSADHERNVRDAFSTIAEWMACQPRVFTHRDFHSRNLMVDGDRLGVLDFQDALLGPATYDLASLLRDSYVALDEALIDRMIDRYITGMRAGLDHDVQERMLLTDRAEFRRLFDFTSIQRNLKAAGRFVYIDRVKGNPKFLAEVPRTLGYVRTNLEKYPECSSLLRHLTPSIPEWQ